MRLENGIVEIKRRVRAFRRLRSIRIHRTRMDSHDAVKYSDYLEKCRRAFRSSNGSLSSDLANCASVFLEKGFTSFHSGENQTLATSILEKIKAEEKSGAEVWNSALRYQMGDIFQKFPEVEAMFRGATGDLLRKIYGAHYKIYYGVIYKSVSSEAPSSSQLWHADGGPGTCINLMFCLSEVNKRNGSMEALPWRESVEIFKTEDRAYANGTQSAEKVPVAQSREEYREVLCNYYKSQIDKRYAEKVFQPEAPAGLIYPFRNNVLHKGGYPQPGHTRYVSVFHIYPSETPTPFEKYREFGIPKLGPYPKDPAF